MSNIVGSAGGDGFKKFMGGLMKVVSAPVAVVSGAVGGIVRSIDKGSLDEFGQGFEEVADKVFEGAQSFGEEHGPVFITTVTAIVVGDAINKSRK